MKKLSLLILFALSLSACGAIDSNVDGDTDSEAAGSDEVAEEVAMECPEGSTYHDVMVAPLEFCYDSAWGEISRETEHGRRGKSNVINFSNAEVSLTYQTDNFASETPGPTLCMSCFYKADGKDIWQGAIVEYLADLDILGVEKGQVVTETTRIGEKFAVKAFMPDPVLSEDGSSVLPEQLYFVAGALPKHSIMIEADAEVDISVFLDTMRF